CHLLALPMHAGGALVINLHAIHADISLPCSWITRDYTRQGNKASTILRPAFQDGKIEEREVVFLDYLFASTCRYRLGKEFPHIGQHRKHLQFPQEALRRLHVQQLPDAFSDLVE